MDERDGHIGEKMKTVGEKRVFQIEKAGAHPSEGYPCRVDVVGGGRVRAVLERWGYGMKV